MEYIGAYWSTLDHNPVSIVKHKEEKLSKLELNSAFINTMEANAVCWSILMSIGAKWSILKRSKIRAN